MAEKLGYANPDLMLSEMNSKHVIEWGQYLSGDEPADPQQSAQEVESIFRMSMETNNNGRSR